MPIPPPKALPIASVRAARPLQRRDSMTAPMPTLSVKSNGTSALSDRYEPAGAGVVHELMSSPIRLVEPSLLEADPSTPFN